MAVTLPTYGSLPGFSVGEINDFIAIKVVAPILNPPRLLTGSRPTKSCSRLWYYPAPHFSKYESCTSFSVARCFHEAMFHELISLPTQFDFNSTYGIMILRSFRSPTCLLDSIASTPELVSTWCSPYSLRAVYFYGLYEAIVLHVALGKHPQTFRRAQASSQYPTRIFRRCQSQT
ncbi:hypothetical protein M422DRAFT_248794 [Sphaerobolus stellatus SS14]|nr:hypothetical protein M422DRAFT_248794 [Sphaerobolus stellatus SS14]